MQERGLLIIQQFLDGSSNMIIMNIKHKFCMTKDTQIRVDAKNIQYSQKHFASHSKSYNNFVVRYSQKF